MVTPHTPTASPAAASTAFASPHLSKKMARHAERLHATFSLRQQAAIDAANREREAWLAWRREVKARREAKEAAAVQEQLVPGSQAKKDSKDKASKASKAGKKDRKSRKLKAEEKGARKAMKDRKDRTVAKAKTNRPASVAKEVAHLDSAEVSSTTANSITSSAVVGSSTPTISSVERPTAPTPAPVASTSATEPAPILTPAPPLPPSPRLAPSPPLEPSNSADIPALDLSHSDPEIVLEHDDDWSDYYSDDDQDPEWLSDDESELAEDDFKDLILEEGEDDSWFFSVPTLSKMASSIRTHLRQERKELEVDGPGWGVRMLSGGGMVFV